MDLVVRSRSTITMLSGDYQIKRFITVESGATYVMLKAVNDPAKSPVLASFSTKQKDVSDSALIKYAEKASDKIAEEVSHGRNFVDVSDIGRQYQEV